MAVPNMIVTLLANTEKYAAGLNKAGAQTKSFGTKVTNLWNSVLTAGIAAGAAILRALPDFIQLGVDVQHADAKLQVMANNMLGMGKKTQKTVARLKEYSTVIMKQTAIDDEQIKQIQAKLLGFNELSKSADEVGGMFDRVTIAAINMSKLGFGDAEGNAVKLARMMQDPIKAMGVLTRAGVVFTEKEKQKATRIAETNGKLQAADYLLGRIERKYSSIAEASTTDYERLQVLLTDSAEQLSTVLLPAVEKVSQAFIDWLEGPGGKKAVGTLTDNLVKMGEWLDSPSGIKAINRMTDAFDFLADALGPVIDALSFIADLARNVSFLNLVQNIWGAFGNASPNGGNWNDPSLWNAPSGTPQDPGGSRRMGSKSPSGIVVNFNTPVDSVSAGREVAKVLADYNRANGYR